MRIRHAPRARAAGRAAPLEQVDAAGRAIHRDELAVVESIAEARRECPSKCIIADRSASELAANSAAGAEKLWLALLASSLPSSYAAFTSAGGRVVMGVDAKVVQDSLGGFRGWDDRDDFHVTTALVALEDVDGEYAPEKLCPGQGGLAHPVRISRSELCVDRFGRSELSSQLDNGRAMAMG